MQRKWWLFRATDFQTLMHPCFIICRIFGIFPYKINKSVFEISKPHYILSITIICALCIFELLHEFNIFIKSDFAAITVSLERICSYILIDSVAIVVLLSSCSRMRLLQTIMEISSRLSPESYQKLSRLIHAKDIFGLFYVIGLMFICLSNNRFDTLTMLFCMYVGVMLFQLDMLYMNCVSVVKACFKEINNNLLHMREFIVNNESHVLTMFYYEQKNSFLIMKLKALKKQHIMISNTVQMLNMTFSFQLLVSIVLTILGLTLELFYNVEWHNGLTINLEQIGEMFLSSIPVSLFGIMYYIVKMASIAWICETGKNQANEIRTTIHNVLNSTRNKQMKDELQSFSLYLLHRNNTFSAKAFNIDAKFVATIVGTITTYIFIVLQFLFISISCNEKSAINIT